MANRSETRTPLSTASITRAAMELIDRDGLEQLSMRKLGAALGYEAMALYKHVADKQAVIDAAVAAAFDEIVLPDPSTAWQERLRSIARELRHAALRHPHLLVPMMTSPPPTPAVIERIDAILVALRDSGASDEQVTHHFWLFVNATTGALVAEARSLVSRPMDSVELDGLDDEAAARIDECRAMSHFGAALAACDFGAEYERLLDAIIDAVS